MDSQRFSWRQAQSVLEMLSSLSYRDGEIYVYLNEIACIVSNLLELDWSVVTLCWDGKEKVMASSIDLGEGEKIYSLHGSVTNTVVETGKSLCVEDVRIEPEYGEPPDGYLSYLGVPLRTSVGETIGTICSFCQQPREFLPEEVRTMELFAERAATAIDNYNLYQKQQRFNEYLEAEVKKRTEELQIAQAQLIEKERLAAIGEFASMIVHEIRNPMTTILMGLNYLKKICVSKLDQERVCLALDEVKRLQNLLQEILLYAKPQVMQVEKLDLKIFVENMLTSLKEMPEASGKAIELNANSSSGEILADKDKLKQVLINLVRNGCEAIAPGEVVSCQIERVTDNKCLCLKVHNRGTPIPGDILPKLTQPFCSTKPGGTGLGLAIVKRIVTAHGGYLSIESQPTTGTTIRVILPLAK